MIPLRHLMRISRISATMGGERQTITLRRRAWWRVWPGLAYDREWLESIR